MGFLRSLLGRSTGPAAPKADPLFALPSAAITLEVSAGFLSTGTGALAVRIPAGEAFERVRRTVVELLDLDGPPVQISTDRYGYTWFLCSVDADAAARFDVGALVTEMNAIVSSLQAEGFGPQLLCALVHLQRRDEHLNLVYLFKQGTFYPFAPRAGASEQTPERDGVLEFEIRDLLAKELPIESDTSRWHPLWDAPGVSGSTTH